MQFFRNRYTLILALLCVLCCQGCEKGFVVHPEKKAEKPDIAQEPYLDHLAADGDFMGWLEESSINRYGHFTTAHTLSASVDVVGTSVKDLFNSYFSSWIEEADLDRYGFITPGDILASGMSSAEKGLKISKYLITAKHLSLSEDESVPPTFLYVDRNIIALALREDDRILPLFSIDTTDSRQCFITYPSDHYRIFIEPEDCRSISDNISHLASANRYESFYARIREMEWFKKGVDIIASSTGKPHNAKVFYEYFRSISKCSACHGGFESPNLSIYRDANTIALVTTINGEDISAFSVSMASLGNCHLNVPPLGLNLPVDIASCRLLRSAHPFLESIGEVSFDPETWIEPADEAVIVAGSEMQKFNSSIIRQANEIWTGLFPGEPLGLWDIANLPLEMSIADVMESKITVRLYPFLRSPKNFILRKSTKEDIAVILDLMNIPGKIDTIMDEDSGKVLLSIEPDPDFMLKKIKPNLGWVTQRSDLRAVPSDDAALTYATDDDHFQYTGLNAEQPVVIIHESKHDGKSTWYYVLSTKVRGWVRSDSIAKGLPQYTYGDPGIALLGHTPHLTVIAPQVELGGRILEMGTRLKVVAKDAVNAQLVVHLSKNHDGNLIFEEIRIKFSDVASSLSAGADFFEGIVPFSRANMIRLLFRYLGTPWGMAGERRGDSIEFVEEGGNRELYIDCSGIMANTMSAMGIYGAARNSWLQSNQGRVVWNKDRGVDIEDFLNKAGKEAWMIGFPGHVVFYLGQSSSGKHMIIHSPGHFRKYLENGDFIRNGDGMAVISELGLSRMDEKFSSAMSPK